MKYFLICGFILFSACKLTTYEKLEKELKNHVQPKDSIINELKIGETISLEESERQGVNNRFREFDYWSEIDEKNFEFTESKAFSDPDEAGGMSYTLHIYKAKQKGYTEIRFFKRKNHLMSGMTDTTKKDTATILYNTYRFNIK
ncbi:hypothetical protein LK994_03920 [Ferruginibacter lapsinanis]|uniref:hypothetical protein n=1 Tax=Ferruginibacter lapsinanis TaxID=563172 RepID=UPI001E563674|nr:hypothetical protein [Ferruginibacter lapsinanis]UEG50617.1 hypothetical protein LK994_03920 [Ferruginibacter lapsinanis]